MSSEKVLERHPVNKRQSANQFRNQSQRTKSLNTAAAPMRGGLRL